VRAFRIPSFCLILFAAGAANARAQMSGWGVGASGGVVAAAENGFHFDDFHRSDVNVWVDYAIEPQVLLRGTVGRMHVAAYNAGQTVTIDGSPVAVPEDLRDRIDYGTLGVAYEFVESAWKSGGFAGVGAYHVQPGDAGALPPQVADQHETVWGFHVGADAEVFVWHTLGILGRVTVHIPQTSPHRVLVAADAGVSYRF
jgi:hypothetical protein